MANLEPMKRDLEVELIENTYVVSTRPLPPRTKALVYINGEKQEKEPDYFNGLRNVFLFDLRQALPDLPEEELAWRAHFMIGAMAHEKRSFQDGFAVITSRASSEMVQKAATVGMPLLAAISAPV